MHTCTDLDRDLLPTTSLNGKLHMGRLGEALKPDETGLEFAQHKSLRAKLIAFS